MANMMDYLDWRGDITLEVSPFNEVDALILAELSFVDFEGIVPPPEIGRGIALHEAAELYFSAAAARTTIWACWSPDDREDAAQADAQRALRQYAAQRLCRAAR